MRFLAILSDLMIPLLIFSIVGFALLMKCSVFDDFISGAKSGLRTIAAILPSLIGLMVAVGVLRSSGFLDFLSRILGKLLSPVGFPPALVPLSIIRMFSSSAATGLLLDLYKEYGTDSYIGLAASVMMCCTETIFYTMSVYFAAAHVTKTRYTLLGALISTASGIAVSLLLAGRLV
ncbi:MAG: nucleoside recognition domain-containing protein [Fusicatenibacter sp.]|nr:nucleoside recognition domain-containing protein [Lachnospiraceae bacterium]MDY2937780.1 nucleoside recognition domain-containing protein [Fusicatenibacter sp.]